MNHIVKVLEQMPQGLRGFTINVGSFVNSTYNLQLATEIHCQTGLNFILDTSRNGGLFSERTLEEINECTYDPPHVDKGSPPGWAGGSKNKVEQKTSGIPDISAIDDHGADEYSYEEYESYDYRKRRDVNSGTMELTQPSRKGGRKKRWSLDDAAGAAGGYDYGGYGGDYGAYDEGAAGGYDDYYEEGGYDDYYYGDYDPSVLKCLELDVSGGHDANCWVKTPGEADGRMYASGTFHECLLSHSIECSDSCPQYVPKVNGEFERPDNCVCN